MGGEGLQQQKTEKLSSRSFINIAKFESPFSHVGKWRRL